MNQEETFVYELKLRFQERIQEKMLEASIKEPLL